MKILVVLTLFVFVVVQSQTACDSKNCWQQIKDCAQQDSCKQQFMDCSDKCHNDLRCLSICSANNHGDEIKKVGECVFSKCVMITLQEPQTEGEQELDLCSEYRCGSLKEDCEHSRTCIGQWNKCMIKCSNLRSEALYQCLNPCFEEEPSISELNSCLRSQCENTEWKIIKY